LISLGNMEFLAAQSGRFHVAYVAKISK